MYIKRKMSTQGYNMWQPFFSVLDYLTSHDHDLTSYDLFWPFDLKNSIIITKNKGMLHYKENMYQQVWGLMIDHRLTFIELLT